MLSHEWTTQFSTGGLAYKRGSLCRVMHWDTGGG